MKKNKLFISCEEAQLICDKTQYGEASLIEKIKLSMRLSWCHITRSYSKKNSTLTTVVKNSNIEYLKTHELKTLSEKFTQQLTNNS